MKRRGWLRSDPDKTRQWQRRSRKPLNPVSERRRKITPTRREVVAEVIRRDGYRCRLAGVGFGECMGRLTAHEILPRGRSHRDENLLDPAGMVSVCAQHNDALSNTADLQAAAYDLGLLRHSWDPPPSV